MSLCTQLIILIVVFVGHTLSNQKFMSWIRSPRITQWGKWGSPAQCPNDSWVGGMALKIDASQGWRADSATLNAIQLHCINMKWIHSGQRITSAEGSWGNYHKTKYCPRGFATGYQLRSEKHATTDDGVALDFKLKCTNFDGSTSDLINSENNLPWGTWSSERLCPSKMIVCGIITQVEPSDEGNKLKDETPLSDVDLACCKIPNPAEACQLETKWETVVICPEAKRNCHMNLTTGFTEDKKTFEFAKFYEKLGFIVDFVFAQNALQLKAVDSKSFVINGKSLETIISETKISKRTTKIQLHCEGISQQLVIMCGSYRVYTKEYRCVPNGDQGINYKGGLFFQPISLSENILWSYNCDFDGGNLRKTKTLSENCGDLCLLEKECTHFTWTKDGICWLKGTGVKLNPIEKYDEGLVCGWIERHLK